MIWKSDQSPVAEIFLTILSNDAYIDKYLDQQNYHTQMSTNFFKDFFASLYNLNFSSSKEFFILFLAISVTEL